MKIVYAMMLAVFAVSVSACQPPDEKDDAGVDAGEGEVEDGGVIITPAEGEDEDPVECNLSCDGVCVDSSSNRDHCGECDSSVNENEVCMGGEIKDCSFTSACAFDRVVLVEDAFDSDNAAASAFLVQLNTVCEHNLDVETIKETNTSAIFADNGLVRRKNRLVAASGGHFVNRVVAGAEILPGALNVDTPDGDTVVYTDTEDDEVVLQVVIDDEISPTHDFIVVQTVINAATNQLIVMAYGLGAEGTVVAWDYIATNLPAHRWELLEWNKNSATPLKMLAFK